MLYTPEGMYFSELFTYNSEGKKIYSEEAAYLNESVKNYDIYDIDILGEKNIKVQIDTGITNTFIE